MYLELFSALCAVISGCLAYTAYLFSRQARRDAESLIDARTELRKLSTTVTALETDFMDKYEHAMKKMRTRQAMRDKRENESEDSNTQQVILPE